MMSNDITISLNELFKYFDTVNIAVSGVILVPRFSAHQFSYMYSLERGKELC